MTLFHWIKRLFGRYKNRKKHSRIKHLFCHMQAVNRKPRRLT